MVSLSFQQSLMLYLWFPLTALLLFLLLIARFYEKFTGERTYFRFLLIPIIVFGIALVRYASINVIAGDEFADVLFGSGGVILMAFCVRLYWLMIVQQGKTKGR